MKVGQGESYKFTWDGFVVLERAEKQISQSLHLYLAGGIVAHMLCSLCIASPLRKYFILYKLDPKCKLIRSRD